MTAYGRELDRAVNIQLMIDRIKQEAEDMEQLATMIKAEVLALADLYMDDYYEVTMYSKVLEFPDKDYVAVGQVTVTEEDWENRKYKYIIPYSTIEDGEYVVHYKVM